MPRYLTPGKIALLALVHLYVESRFPHPAILPVLSFVIRHLVSTKDNNTFVLTLEELKNETVTRSSAIVGRTIYDLLLKKLWEVNSLDALHLFVADAHSHLVDFESKPANFVRVSGQACLLSRASILGCFVRRTHLEYVRLQFGEVVSLWLEFVQYRAPTLAVWKKRNLSAGPLSFDENLKGMDWTDPLVQKVYGGMKKRINENVSTDDIERLLEFQVDVMQRMGTRIPDRVEKQLKKLLGSNVSIPALSHYVEFLNSWRAGDYPGSFDSLHRYFDYTMHSRERTFYQYALLNLAILQADFGCYRESVLAMQETINTARENKDTACLNFSLSWLYHFHKAHPQDCPEIIASRMESDSLHFLKAKAKEGGMLHLQSMAHLSEAKQILLGGESLPTAFESLMRSSHLNITKQIKNAMGSQILLQSSLWSRLGVSYLSWISCELFLVKYQPLSPVEDATKALCRGAYYMSLRGRFEEAIERLDLVEHDALRSLKVYQHWAAYVGVIKLKRAIYMNELAAADLLLQQLITSPYVEPDCALEISVSQIELHVQYGNLSKAVALADQLLDELMRDRADVYHRIRLMILRADIFARCGRATKGLSIALSAASEAWQARLLPGLFYALKSISRILIQLGEFGAAFNLLDAIMPQVLECEDSGLNANCFMTLADAQAGLASTKVGVGKNESLHRALDFIDRAFTEYSRIRDVTSQKLLMSRKTRVQQYLGDRLLRNDAVKLFRGVDKGNSC